YFIDYPLADGSGSVTVATVRPETMLADTAVAVHPGDERYADLVGRRAILPLVGRELPIIADSYVKPEFGTGALKITPGHDPNDFEIGRRHRLGEPPGVGGGGRIRRTPRGEEPRTQEDPPAPPSGERIEPLVSLQWFMRMDELARPAIDAVSNGDV